MDTAERAIEVLRGGGIVIFPTDTAFGIGCRIDHQLAVDRLFDLRQRQRTHATPVLVSNISMALPYLNMPSSIVRHLMQTYWPGALTIVSACNKDMVYSPIRGGGDSIGFRAPDHDSIRRIIDEVGVPILGPSANFHGHLTPYSTEDLDPELLKKVDFILEGECKKKSVSTVVDCTTFPCTILRAGAIALRAQDLASITLLRIDTRERDSVEVEVAWDNHVKKRTSRRHGSLSQAVLPLIEEALADVGLKPEDIDEIQVETGPGSYTGLRVGIAVASALSTLFHIPINGKPAGSVIDPVYPNEKYITGIAREK
ncbi:MAG: L-threonylcarbamoyladenylate synthase [bacterium]|nr:L-threonylcarbamoyladenylate synthase [bacterium]